MPSPLVPPRDDAGREPAPYSATGIVRSAFRLVEWELAALRELMLVPARVLILLDSAEAIVRRIDRASRDVERLVSTIDGLVVEATNAVDEARRTVRRAGEIVGEVEVTLERTQTAVGEVETTVERAKVVIGDVEIIAGRATVTVGEVEKTVGRANVIAGEVEKTVAKAGGLATDIESTVERADGIATDIESTVAMAGGAVAGLDDTVARVAPLVDFAESTVKSVQPVVRALLIDNDLDPAVATRVAKRFTELVVMTEQIAEQLRPFAVTAADALTEENARTLVALVDRVPELTSAVQTDVIPVISGLDSVAPEVSEILEVAKNCLEALSGIPGFAYLRRRGDRRSES